MEVKVIVCVSSFQGAITKRMTAIEEMAGMDVLCSDKTGTLTLNKLTVDKNLIEVLILDPVICLIFWTDMTVNYVIILLIEVYYQFTFCWYV